MDIFGIIISIIFVGIGCFYVCKDIKLTKKIMKNDVSAKKELENLIDKKTKLYYTEEDFENISKNPFEFSRKKFVI